MENQNVCCICGEQIVGYGNSAEPVKSGRCCDKCNITVVKRRISEFLNAIENGVFEDEQR